MRRLHLELAGGHCIAFDLERVTGRSPAPSTTGGIPTRPSVCTETLKGKFELRGVCALNNNVNLGKSDALRDATLTGGQTLGGSL